MIGVRRSYELTSFSSLDALFFHYFLHFPFPKNKTKSFNHSPNGGTPVGTLGSLMNFLNCPQKVIVYWVSPRRCFPPFIETATGYTEETVHNRYRKNIYVFENKGVFYFGGSTKYTIALFKISLSSLSLFTSASRSRILLSSQWLGWFFFALSGALLSLSHLPKAPLEIPKLLAACRILRCCSLTKDKLLL
jgi:hypothetical protein